MTVYADASALVARHLDVPARTVAVDTFAADDTWCTSAMALTEALALIDRLTDDLVVREELEDLVRLDGRAMYDRGALGEACS